MIYSFADITSGQRQDVGGKAATLAHLLQAGYPVPAGLVIPVSSFENGSLRPDAWDVLLVKLTQLHDGRTPLSLAVRSSATAEDGTQTSFAGEFDTVLNIVGDAALYEAIHQVHESGQVPRVAAYAQAHGIAEQMAVAVIVQQMVPADFAGVLFTSDPVNGSHAAMVGNFVHGLGEPLVGGAVNGDPFKLKRPSGRYEGPAALRPYARRLYKMARRLTDLFAGPQDIEWAIAGGRLYLLQTRPVTTMQAYDPATGAWNDSKRGRYLWTNSNFGEAVPGVMTPLTWSLIQIYVEEVFPVSLPGHHPVMGNIGGRFYLNISLMASMMRALGFNERRINEESEEFFGHLPPDLEIPTVPFSRWTILRKMLPRFFQVQRIRRRLLQRLESFTAELPAQGDLMRKKIEETRTANELGQLWQEELEPLLRQACRMLHAGTTRYENLYRPLQRRLKKEAGPAAAITLLSGVSRDEAQLSSLGPMVGLWRVAHGEMSREEYRQQYGHRGPHELELSWPRPAEDPTWLEQQLANLAGTDVPALLAKQQARRQAAWQQYRDQFPRKAAATNKELAQAAAAARGREAIRSELTRLFWVIRDYALRAGELLGLGDGVFFLDRGELVAALAGKDDTAVAAIPARRTTHAHYKSLPPYPAIINGRFDPDRWATDPQRRSDLFNANTPPADAPDNATTISGFPGSPGIVSGSVRRLENLEQGHLLQPGEILVTQSTNIGWTPLFPRAAAIVTDVGAPLSHAAIVARELGKTAVVGCGNATMLLKTGDYVRVNGNLGTVELRG